MTHICASIVTIIGSDNGLSPGRRQAIIWTNAGILLIGPLGTNFNEIVIEIHTFSFKKIHFKMSSGKWRPFCLGLNVLPPEVRQSCCDQGQSRPSKQHDYEYILIALHIFYFYQTIFRKTNNTNIYTSVSNALDNGLPPGRCFSTIWTNTNML